VEIEARIRRNGLGTLHCQFFNLATLNFRVLGLIATRVSLKYHNTQRTSPIRYFKLLQGILESFASSDFVKYVPNIFTQALKSDSLKS